MPSQIYRTATEEETIALGRRLAPDLRGAVLLIGNLGAGKTTLAKGIVEGRGAAPADAVSSPTFTLVHQYSEDVFHVDLYRLDEPREIESLGLRDLFDNASLVLLEWAERFPQLMPPGRTEIRLRALDDETREILVDRVVALEPMTTHDIANELVRLCSERKFEEAVRSLYSPEIVSMEAGAPPGMSRESKGLDAVLAKGAWWAANHDVHSIGVEGPLVAGSHFTVAFKIAGLFKPDNRTFQMDEIAVYQVSGGKIVREEFFYAM